MDRYYLIPVLSTIGALMGGYLSQYLKTKGQNLATKEDIHEITEKVESVKKQINKKADFENDEKLVLINFYESYIKWFEKIIRFEVSSYDESSIIRNNLMKLQNEAEMLRSIAFVSMYKLKLFISSDQIILSSENLYQNTLTYFNSIPRQVYNITDAFSAHPEEYFSDEEEATYEIELRIRNLAKLFYDNRKKFFDQHELQLKEYRTVLLNFLKPS
jgi:hypothetical protein